MVFRRELLRLGLVAVRTATETWTSTSTSTSAAHRLHSIAKSRGTGLSRSRSFFSLATSRQLPQTASEQQQYVKELLRNGQNETVVSLWESGQLASPEGVFSEYVTALARLGRLDGTGLMETLRRGYASSAVGGVGGLGVGGLGVGGGTTAAGTTAAGATAAATTTGLGTSANPIYMMQAEPTFLAQMWRSVRVLGLAFLFMAGLGAMAEERGLSKGIMNNPEVQPQMETGTKFSDVKGVDEAKGELEEIVEYLRDPDKFTTLGGKLPKGVLLVGPPGTGKTMLARAIAGEAGVPFFYTSGSEFEEMFVGVGARRVRDLFAAAKKTSPCIIFIDEIDAIGGSRNPKDQQYMKMTLNQLLVEMDGFKSSEGVIVIAATNFPESLDKALVRPGRFDRHVVVPNPDVKGRSQILESHFKGIKKAADVDLTTIARGTPGFSGADLANLINIAALRAASEGAKAVDMQALEYAKDRILMGAERKSAVISEKNRKLTAYHEGGHALVALYTDGAHPVHKATVVPRGMALGMVMQLPESDDETSVTRKQLLAKLDVAMGGRAAEELIFGAADVTTGASSDLEQATRLARAMVTKYGMSDLVGQVAIGYEDLATGKISSETRALVESEVKKLLTAAHQRAVGILKAHEKELHTLAKELIEKETLSGRQIVELVGIHSPRSEASGGV